jgi:hypothetical protein
VRAIQQPLRRPRKHSDRDFGHGREQLRWLQPGGVGVAGMQWEVWEPESEEFPLHPGNPHNVPARRFPSRDEEKDWAISCDLERGPDFSAITVHDGCNGATSNSASGFGHRDTGLEGGSGACTFLTGWDDSSDGDRSVRDHRLDSFLVTSSSFALRHFPLTSQPAPNPSAGSRLTQWRGSWFRTTCPCYPAVYSLSA